MQAAGEKLAVGRPGIDVEHHARAGRRRRHHHAVEFPDRHSGLEDRAGAWPTATAWSSSRPTWCRDLPGRWPRSSSRRSAGGRLQPGHGPRLGGRAKRSSTVAGIDADHLHRLGRDRAQGGRGLHRAHAKKFSSKWAARIRWSCSTTPTSKIAVDVRRQRRVLLDRPALHRVVAPDRHRGHSRPLRRGGHRAPEGARRRRRAQDRHADRPGGRPEPARPGPPLHRDRPGRRREARLRRRAAERAKRRASTCSRRSSPKRRSTCGSTARKSSGRWRA